MGKTLRTKRLTSVLKIEVIKIRREAGGRITTCGQLLLVLFFLATVPIPAQTRPDITPDVAAKLKRQIETGSTEEKRTALSEIRNLRSSAASAIALPALRDRDELVR